MEQTFKVLVVEDDPNLGTLLTEYLNAKSYKAQLAKDGVKGLEIIKKEPFDFLIFDVMMPNMDGFTLAEAVRTTNKDVPILFLTAKNMREDTLKGFSSGGDDYMTKPFSMEELLARMDAILRRTGKKAQQKKEKNEHTIGHYTFDYRQQSLLFGGEKTKLTTKENELMKLLVEQEGGVLDRSLALSKVWGDDNYFNGRSMDVYIAKLRKHLQQDETVQILNVHGKGFRLLSN